MDLERRQREAGLPPLRAPEPLPNDLDANRGDDAAEREAARAREASRRSRERRAKKKKSAGRARTALVAGSLLAMLGLGGAMWLGADDGTAQTEPAPTSGQGATAQPEPDAGIEVPAAPQASPAPAERAPQVSSGAS